MKLDMPWSRSNQIVGSSATGSRARRALATNSIPISNPASESMPTWPDEVHVVGLERVGGVPCPHPGDPGQRQPGQTGQRTLEKRSAHLLATARVPGRGRDDDAAFDQPHQLVDLPGIVRAVGHRDHDDVSQ